MIWKTRVMKDNLTTPNLKGLTTDGIVCQMISALKTYKLQQYGSSTVNDCQVVLNHLIRKYSEPSKTKIYDSKELNPGQRNVREHAIPVKVIMQYLLGLSITISDEDLKETIKEYLNKNLIIVRLTPAEDKLLTKAGVSDSMPQGYSDPTHEYDQDIWSRYKLAGIYENIIFPTE